MYLPGLQVARGFGAVTTPMAFVVKGGKVVWSGNPDESLELPIKGALFELKQTRKLMKKE